MTSNHRRGGSALPAAALPLRLAYQSPDCVMTLAEGLEEYYGGILELTDPAGLPLDEAAFFRAHDVSHVVFGCDTSAAHELRIGAWTFCGTTASLGDILRYARSQEVGRIRREFGYLQGVKLFLSELPRLWRIARSARRMTRRWPLLDYEAYLNRPLQELRTEFNIDLQLR